MEVFLIRFSGLIDFLLRGTPEAPELLPTTEFHIVPMQNIDGVISGNFRSTPQSENLEVMWLFDRENPSDLLDGTPPEIKLIHSYARELMNAEESKVSIALNLHAANSDPDIQTFFFPHFGTQEQGYTPEESSLWNKQVSFITTLAKLHGQSNIESTVTEGGGSFADKSYPESWWWANFQDDVMAITMETTYGRVSQGDRWSEPQDYRNLGSSLALAIGEYDQNSIVDNPTVARSTTLDLHHPAYAEDELKQ